MIYTMQVVRDNYCIVQFIDFSTLELSAVLQVLS